MSRERLGTVVGAIRLIRLHSCLQAALYALLGFLLSDGPLQHFSPRATSAALSVMLVAASGFALNDWADVNVDAISHPNRALPSGRLSRRGAAITSFSAAALAFVAAWPLGMWSVTLVAINLLVSGAYSVVLKGRLFLGNFAVAYLNATILIFGGMAAGRLTPTAWLVSGLAFVFTCAQEVLYNISDYEADVQLGVRTTAVRLGKAGSIQLFSALVLFLALACVAAAAVSSRPTPYLLALGLFTILPFAYILSLLRPTMSAHRLNRACLMMGAVRIASLAPALLWRGTVGL